MPGPRITVNNPSSGAWTIQVHGHNVPSGSSTFSLVVTGSLQNKFLGWVEDASSGSGLSGASVAMSGRIDTYSLATNSYGYYSQEVRPDKYTITASRCDYEPASTTRKMEPGLWETITFELVPRETGTAYGYVKDSSGTPLANANVKDTCTGASTSTASNGYYSLSIPGNTSISLKATKTGYFPQSKSVNIPYGGTKRVDFSLSPIGGGGCTPPPPCPISVGRSLTQKTEPLVQVQLPILVTYSGNPIRFDGEEGRPSYTADRLPSDEVFHMGFLSQDRDVAVAQCARFGDAQSPSEAQA